MARPPGNTRATAARYLRVEHAQALIHVVERDVEAKILRAQFLTNAPGGRGSDKADTESTYYRS
jgi:hypothetical protein